MGDWFVFYMQIGKEQTACDFLNKLINRHVSIAFIPKIEIIFKNSKIIRKELKPMFPGYVFIDSTEDERIFISQAYDFVRYSNCIFKILGNQYFDYMKLSEKEKKYLLSFYDKEYVTKESRGFISNDKVYITSGPLKGRESLIKRIDRHKRRAEVEIACLDDIRRINVSLEIVSKTL